MVSDGGFEMRRRNSKLNFKWAVNYLIRQGYWHEWGRNEIGNKVYIHLRYGSETMAGRVVVLTLESDVEGKFLSPSVEIATRAHSQNIHLTAHCYSWSKRDLDHLACQVIKLLVLQEVALDMFDPPFDGGKS